MTLEQNPDNAPFPYYEHTPPQIKRELAFEEALDLLFTGNKPIMMCGMAFSGDEGYPTKIISILRINPDEEALEGWCYQHRFKDPEKYRGEGLHRVTREDTSFAELPQTMFDVVAEVDDSLIPEDNKTIAENVIAWSKTLDDRIALP